MSSCVICKGAHPDWRVTTSDKTQDACKDHVSKVLSDIGRGVYIIVRGAAMTSREPTEAEREAQRIEWQAYVAQQHAKGLCEFSGLKVSRCVRSICDCFETLEGAAEIERKAAGQ